MTANFKNAWGMTLKEYSQAEAYQIISGVAPYSELTPEMKELARAAYINETNDPQGADENSGEFVLNEFFFSTATGTVIGDDFIGHRREVELALMEGRYVPTIVLDDYPDMKKDYIQKAKEDARE